MFDNIRNRLSHVLLSGSQQVHLSQISFEMHRNTTPSYMMQHSLPSPEYTGDSDSDSDIIKELEQKRRELDEDVARFRAQKDKEFRDFEVELKATRQKRAQPHQDQRNDHLLNGCGKHARSSGAHHVRQSSASIQLIKPKAGSKVTHPTISLNPTNIRGETIQQSHALYTPPTPTAQLPITTEKTTIPIEQSSSRGKAVLSPQQPRKDAFTGVFVPDFLPLLDSMDDRLSRPAEGTQTEPASPIDRLVIETMPVQASSLPTASSISEGFHIVTNKRAYTSPSAVNRTTLPPIIRNVNGRKRSSGKRKHVTFQLADRAIVEPSSDYEEGSPLEIGEEDSITSPRSTNSENNSPRPRIVRQNTPLDPFGRRKRKVIPEVTSPDEVGMGMGDLHLVCERDAEFLPPPNDSVIEQPSTAEFLEDGYFSPKHGTSSTHFLPNGASTSDSLSPAESESFNKVDEDAYIHKRYSMISQQRAERKNIRSPPLSPGPLRAATPIIDLVQPTSRCRTEYPGSLADNINATANVGFFELDEELASPDAETPKPYETATTDDIETPTLLSSRRKKQDHESAIDMVTGTSVPIDIIRPQGMNGVSNSWIGTFGH